MLYFTKIFWKPLLWALVILVLSGIPGQIMESYEIWNADKLVHTFIYFGFTLLLMAGCKKTQNNSFMSKNSILLALAISILYGGLMEILQATVFINRSGNIPDFLFNSLGAVLAVMTFSFWMKIKTFRKILQ